MGVRPRQLSVRTLVVGMLVCQAEGRPAHLRALYRVLSGWESPTVCTSGSTSTGGEAAMSSRIAKWSGRFASW